MFFYLSKLFWFLIQPDNLIAMSLAGAVIFAWLGWRKTGFVLTGTSAVMYLVFVTFAAGQYLIAPLENRFPANPDLSTPPDGIILLSGPIDSRLTEARGQVSFQEGAERYIEFIGLLNRYPDAVGIVSGGNPSVINKGQGQAELAKLIFRGLGFDSSRIIFETNSRNTFENAVNTRELIKPETDEKWVVVTSAYHMPRAIGTFRHIGWEVMPYPVDYRSEGEKSNRFFTMGGGEALSVANLAIKEWIGLIAYYISGRSTKLFPAAKNKL